MQQVMYTDGAINVTETSKAPKKHYTFKQAVRRPPQYAPPRT